MVTLTMARIRKETEPAEGKRFYTVSQLAELLQLTEMTIYRMINRGELPHYDFGRVKRFSSTDIDEYLQSHRREARQSSATETARVRGNKT